MNSIEKMNQLFTIMMILTIVVSVGTIVNFSIESVDAWHTQYRSTKECKIFMQYTLGNSSLEASKMCNEVIPHEYIMGLDTSSFFN